MAGISMVELILFIIIVSVGIVGILGVFNVAVKGSADPVVRKQAIAIAESLLAEIEQQNFTYCDPQDTVNVLIAGSTATCATSQSGAALPLAYGTTISGAFPNTEVRGSLTLPLNNVADYGGKSWANITDSAGNNSMTGYTATVVITAVALAHLPVDSNPQLVTLFNDAGAALRIDVTVTKPGTDPITLTGYRFRYAPNAAG
jgi:MSHA pilin protein MshD